MSNLRRVKRSLTPVAAGAGATAALAGLLLASPAGAAGVATAAGSGDVAITNRESVEVELTPEGKVDARASTASSP
jgi:ApbE superfamily uncharacterized protein (UPF0280 family)